ncbi:MAG: HD domain-containing protein [Shewanella sp.]
MLEDYEHQCVAFIQAEMKQDLAHDLNHVLRVVKTAKYLCAIEGAKLDVVVPAAYLHDCFIYPKDHPYRAKSSLIAADKALQFLVNIGYPKQYHQDIKHAIVAHSFSASLLNSSGAKAQTLEAQIVQDADRLDALGAIGISRCIQVSSMLGRALYDAHDPFCTEREPNDSLHTIDHFYTKLFKLADTMNTAAAKIEAKKRTEFMKAYLTQLGLEM